MNPTTKRKLAEVICNVLPPIVSQRVRILFYTEADGIKEAANIQIKSITGSVFYGNTTDIHAYTYSVHGFYDWRNVAITDSVCIDGDEIIEIGANIGTETISFSDIVGKKGKVFAFEPLESNLACLSINSERSKLQNIEIFPIGISNTAGFANFTPPPDIHMSGTGAISINNQNKAGIKIIRCETLDSMLEIFSRVRCISIDIEGADLLAIQGAHKVINKYRPVILMESSPKLMKNFGHSQNTVLKEMNELGYQCFTIGKLTISRNLSDISKHNWVCFPVEKHFNIWRTRVFLLVYGLLPPFFSRLIL